MQHTKIYLSMAQSRAFDGPTGDPFGGPAYGKREMPVIAIIGAVMSGVAGAGLIGTTVLGFSGLGTIIGGAMIAGSVLTVVGTLSGNAKMAKIGSMLGLVGGLTAGVAAMTGNIANTATGATMSMGDVFSKGMDNISDAWGSVTGTVNTGTPGLVAPITGETLGVGEVAAVSPPVDGSPYANNPYGAEGVGVGYDPSQAQAVVPSAGSLNTPPSAEALVPSTIPNPYINEAALAEHLPSAADTGSKTSTAWNMKDILKDGGGALIGGAVAGIGTGVGNYLAAGEEAASLAAIRRGEVVRASGGPLLIDPNSPNRAEWEAYATKQGVGTVAFGVAPRTAQPAQYSPLASPQVMAPQAPTVGLLNR